VGLEFAVHDVGNWYNFLQIRSHQTDTCCHGRAVAEMAWGEGASSDSAEHDGVEDAGRRSRAKSGTEGFGRRAEGHPGGVRRACPSGENYKGDKVTVSRIVDSNNIRDYI